ncbi:MAG TPA: cellulase family glycosylhydrolase [Phycisphaerae bacterium]|nr:cellulase family glycosylhydrolase [Phycisphaerae bacterium]
MTRSCLFLSAAGVLLASASAWAETIDRPLIFSINPVGNREAVGAPRQGSDFVRYDELLFQRISEAGSRSARVLASWREVEAEKGKWDWSSLDREIELCAKYHIEPVVLICNIPAWVSPTGKSAHNHPPKEEHAADFTAFITRMAERYKNRAKYYEFWNEQNGCSWINEGCDNARMAHTYLPWLQRCFKAIKAVDPVAQVAIGGLDDADGHAPIFVEQCYQLRRDKYDNAKLWDAIAEHPYAKRPTETTDELIHKLDAIRAVAARYGDAGVPIWITEYGWNVAEMGIEVQQHGTAEFLKAFSRSDQKDVLIAQQLAIADFEPVHLGFGLCDLNLRPRPAFQTFQELARPGTPRPVTLRFVLQPDGVPVINGLIASASEQEDPPSLIEVFNEEGKRVISEKGDPNILSVALPGLPPDTPLLAVISSIVGEKQGIPIARVPFIAPKGLIPNGGFESLFRAGIPWAWTVTGPSICRDGGALGKEYCHGGGHALLLAQLPSSSKRAFDDRIEVPVRAAKGGRIRVRWFARYFGPQDQAVAVMMTASLFDPDEERGGRSPGKPIGKEWTEVVLDLSAPCDGPILCLHLASSRLPKDRWLVAVDDVSVEPLSE